jgi:hypothetical protein
MIQKPLEEFAAVIKANIGGDEAPAADAVGGGVTIEQMQQAVAAGVAPFVAELEALKSASAVNDASPVEPVRRALQTASLGVGQSGPPAEVILAAEYGNPKSDKNVTPGIRAMVRRTVFGKGG